MSYLLGWQREHITVILLEIHLFVKFISFMEGQGCISHKIVLFEVVQIMFGYFVLSELVYQIVSLGLVVKDGRLSGIGVVKLNSFASRMSRCFRGCALSSI